MVSYWIPKVPDTLEEQTNKEFDVSIPKFVKSKGWDLENLTVTRMDELEEIMNKSSTWNSLTDEVLLAVCIKRNQPIGITKIFGKYITEDYQEHFGVNINHLQSPAVYCGIQAHPLEYLWIRRAMEAEDIGDPEEEDELEPDSEAETFVEEESEFDWEATDYEDE